MCSVWLILHYSGPIEKLWWKVWIASLRLTRRLYADNVFWLLKYWNRSLLGLWYGMTVYPKGDMARLCTPKACILEAWPTLWHCQGVGGSLRANTLWKVSRSLRSCKPHGPSLDSMREMCYKEWPGPQYSGSPPHLVSALSSSPTMAKFPPKAENGCL